MLKIFNKMKKILLLTVIAACSFFLSSCSQDDKTPSRQDRAPKNQIEDLDDTGDTVMTAAEKFSTAILIDFLNDSNDGDLAEYLENEIYKLGSGYRGASVIQATPSTWLVILEKDGSTRNYLVQKFLDFTTNESYFRMNETTLTATDIIAGGKRPAGE